MGCVLIAKEKESSICTTIAEFPEAIHARIPDVERRYAKGNTKSEGRHRFLVA